MSVFSLFNITLNIISKAMKESRFLRLIANVILVSVCLLTCSVTFLDPNDFDTVFAPHDKGSVESDIISIIFCINSEDSNVMKIARIFDEKGGLATFFVTAKWAENNGEILSDLVDKGHEIGNHGYLNRDFSALSFSECRDEIKTAERVIEGVCGYKTRIFLPPKGKFSDSTAIACRQLGYNLIAWSKSAVADTPDKVLLLSREARSGDVVLMSTSDVTLSVLDDILDGYIECGFQIKSVSENISTQ